MRFDLIAPANLHAAWPHVRAGLERVLLVSPERWLPEDIFLHIRIGKAQLYVAYEGAERRGFFVAQQQVDTFSNEPYLNVWVLYGEPTLGTHFADVADFVPETIAHIDSIARAAGIKRIRCDGRKGWERFLKGYMEPTKVVYVYEREVQA